MKINWKLWLTWTGIGALFLIVFVIISFPFARLRPQVVNLIQTAIQQNLGISVSCDLQGFDFHFPLGVNGEKLDCKDLRGNSFIELTDVKIVALPGYQKLSASIGKGSLTIKANAGFSARPSQLDVQCDDVSLETLSPLLAFAIRKANPLVPDLKFLGSVSGSLNLPLQNYTTRPGSIDLTFKGLKLPSQNALKQIGLSELSFSKSAIKANISAGKLSISDAAFLSDHISGKLEGSLDLADQLNQSAGNISLKWQVKKSDALMSSPLGAILANAPCPMPDSEGFCTQKISRISDLRMGF